MFFLFRNLGICPRAVFELFKLREQNRSGHDVKIKMYMLEICKGEVNSLNMEYPLLKLSDQHIRQLGLITTNTNYLYSWFQYLAPNIWTTWHIQVTDLLKSSGVAWGGATTIRGIEVHVVRARASYAWLLWLYTSFQIYQNVAFWGTRRVN